MKLLLFCNRGQQLAPQTSSSLKNLGADRDRLGSDIYITEPSLGDCLL
ncbi:hypothetical protein [Laspinema olomoucense]|uniref:Uncharacterized protein n=1 Tax=Laspinema olomoucense D3b TaxID=2953688 RepID=A0ABT2NE90_9CYAN|nr:MULTISPECIES: hypothetical protein [unclassified Laspinema]MCT7972540.1 hypothetical protein [Laspinema sp. D3d]MCT7981024.1 hypothetical protein [Laspinema sp. D3b]MCT7988698.1 hypothetical protein [Laspinema sp. D3a]